jgi:hypothetical protein
MEPGWSLSVLLSPPLTVWPPPDAIPGWLWRTCPNMTSQWKDASPDWGGQPVDGNILAPDATGC